MQYEGFILELGPGKDRNPVYLANMFPNYLVIAIDEHVKSYKEALRTNLALAEKNNLIYAQGPMEDFLKVEVPLNDERVRIEKLRFKEAHAHYLFTSPTFIGMLTRGIRRVKTLRVLKQVAAVLEPGGSLIITGEYKDPEKADLRPLLLKCLKDAGFVKIREPWIGKTVYSDMGRQAGKFNVCIRAKKPKR